MAFPSFPSVSEVRNQSGGFPTTERVARRRLLVAAALLQPLFVKIPDARAALEKEFKTILGA
jgi:hypothetical protein